MGGLEISVPCQLHDLKLSHTHGEPITDRRSAEIVELTVFDPGSGEDLVEIPAKIIDNFEPGIGVGPLSFGPKLLLDVVIPGWWYEHIGVSFRVCALVVNE